MRFLSLFTGVGGFDLGFERAGLECVGQVEIDPTCQGVLKRHWPGKLLGGDIEKYKHHGPKPEILCGGFPCQDLSVAGRRAGLAGGRSGLWYAFRGVIGRLAPKLVIIENVPGLHSSNQGRDFAIVLNGLAQLGYHVAAGVLDSQYFGVPQRRDRVFIVGSLGNGSCAEILFEPESVRGDHLPGREATEGITVGVAGSLGGGSGQRGFCDDLDRSGAFIPQTAPTITAKAAKGTGGRSGDECQNLIGQTLKSEGADGSPDGTGRGFELVVSPIVSNGNAHSGFRDGAGLVATPINLRNAIRTKDRDEINRPGSGIGEEGDPAHSVTSRANAVAIRTANTSSNGHGFHDDLSYTLDRAQGHAIAFGVGEVGYSLRSNPSRSGDKGGVRRLTPRECERLQGFPDDWTRYDAAGKEISDSARYRMLGNAVTVPVARWIGKRILEVC